MAEALAPTAGAARRRDDDDNEDDDVVKHNGDTVLSCFASEELIIRDQLHNLSLSAISSSGSDEPVSAPAAAPSVASLPSRPILLPWDKFSEWLYCVCVVTFDLELGQAMELVYPSHVTLTEKEKTSVCYLAFPDSNSGCMGDTRFHFRFRQASDARVVDPPSLAVYNRSCPVHLQSDPGYYWGYVYFRQVKDKSLPRGYFQKSVVLVSRLPFVNFFLQLVGSMAPEFFANGEPCLEAACHDVDQWPSPTPGETYNLPILGQVIRVNIPSFLDNPLTIQIDSKNASQMMLPAPVILPSVNEVDVFKCLLPILPHVQLVWELVLLAEPLVVMTPSPTQCSETVQSLVSLILPLKYKPDHRPFFTIHDAEFREYTTRTQAPPCVILGVTNPFFAKTLQHWPHIIRIGDASSDDPASAASKTGKLKKGGNLKTLDSKPGVYTRYKPFLNKDKSILKKLVKGVHSKRPAEVQNTMLRRYFLQLTQDFLVPFERYFMKLMPLRKTISPHRGPPRLRPFDQDDFLLFLEREVRFPLGVSGLKGDWGGLYRRFLRSENFAGWLRHRTREIQRTLNQLHLQALVESDLSHWIAHGDADHGAGRAEVEVVDLLLRLKAQLGKVECKELIVSKELEMKLRQQIIAVTDALPGDLQNVVS